MESSSREPRTCQKVNPFKILEEDPVTQLTEAWEIIHVLTMMDIDRKEPWPRALTWLQLNEHHRKPYQSPHDDQ